jgi:hypothetical protein
MKVAWPIVLYPYPQKGIFRVPRPSGEYKIPEGLLQDEKEFIIIGEDDHCYIQEIKEFECGYYEGDVVVKKKSLLPMGVHKSRLVRWTTNVQLTIQF